MLLVGICGEFKPCFVEEDWQTSQDVEDEERFDVTTGNDGESLLVDGVIAGRIPNLCLLLPLALLLIIFEVLEKFGALSDLLLLSILSHFQVSIFQLHLNIFESLFFSKSFVLSLELLLNLGFLLLIFCIIVLLRNGSEECPGDINNHNR